MAAESLAASRTFGRLARFQRPRQLRLADAALRFRHVVLGAHHHAVLGFGMGFGFAMSACAVPVVLVMRGGFALLGAGGQQSHRRHQRQNGHLGNRQCCHSLSFVVHLFTWRVRSVLARAVVVALSGHLRRARWSWRGRGRSGLRPVRGSLCVPASLQPASSATAATLASATSFRVIFVFMKFDRFIVCLQMGRV